MAQRERWRREHFFLGLHHPQAAAELQEPDFGLPDQYGHDAYDYKAAFEQQCRERADLFG